MAASTEKEHAFALLKEKYKEKPDGYRELYTDKEGVEIIYGVPCPLPQLPSNKEHILNWDKSIKDQKWERISIPEDVQELCEEIEMWHAESLSKTESIAKKAFQKEIELSEKLIKHPFVQLELVRKIFGVWIYIKGEPYWLSGHNYIYLQYWELNIGAADFRDRDRRWFTFWNMCEQDPDCYGMIYMKHRQEGATSRACLINYNTVSIEKNKRGGIVSKGKEDAKKAFRIKLLTSYFELPFYLKPATIEKDEQADSLRFHRKAKHGSLIRASKSKSLGSDITYKPETEGAYDGETLNYIHVDEAAKFSMDLAEFWTRHQPCISQGSGTSITGKAIFTSTVGEVDDNNPAKAYKAGSAWRSMWNKSDFWDRNKNNKTTSGLYRYFLPADDGLAGHIDEYGFSIKESAHKHIVNHVTSLRSRRDQISYKRTHPLTEADALTPDNPTCQFDIDLLKEQYHTLNDGEKDPNSIFYHLNYIRGNFKWVGNRMNPETGAYFEAAEDGNWLVFNEDLREISPQTSKRNRTRYVKTTQVKNSQTGVDEDVMQYEPLGSEYVMGFDPYKVEKTVRKESLGSNAAAVVFMRNNPQDSEEGNRPVAFYLGRGLSNDEKLRRDQKMVDTHDTILAAAFFFSAKILYENEIQDFLKFCDACGAFDYLHRTPESLIKKLPSQIRKEENNKEDEQKGVSGKWGSKEKGIRLADEFINENVHKIPFLALIEDLIAFDANNSTKFDLTIAFLLALVAAHEPPKVYRQTKIDIRDFNMF